MVTKILASGKMVTAQEYWPVVRWLQYTRVLASVVRWPVQKYWPGKW